MDSTKIQIQNFIIYKYNLKYIITARQLNDKVEKTPCNAFCSLKKLQTKVMLLLMESYIYVGRGDRYKQNVGYN